jgi:SAM-dependent methyltransferase
MPPTKQSAQCLPAPAAFLRCLGIRRRNKASVINYSFWRAVQKAGGNHDDIVRHGGFSPEAGSVYYITEQIAKRVLSTEYDTLLTYLQYFRRLCESLPSLRKIADIGGGTGIVSMYLAACHPECKATVYDHSPAQLALGRKWTKEQNLRGVRFVQSTYGQLANQVKAGSHDLVMFVRAMDLKLPAPGSGDLSLRIPDCPVRRPSPDIQTAVTAISRLLAPDGVGVISCALSGWGLVTLFESVRRAGLGVDWRRNQCRLEAMEGVSDLKDAHIVVRRGMPRLATSSLEEARAFLNSTDFSDGPRVVKGAALEHEGKRFTGGAELLRAQGYPAVDEVHALRLVQNDGYLLLEGLSTAGPRWGKVHTLSGISLLLDDVQLYLDLWQSDQECLSHFEFKIHPRLKRFIQYCSKD